MDRARWIGRAALAVLLLWLMLFAAPALFNAHDTPRLIAAVLIAVAAGAAMARLAVAALTHVSPPPDGRGSHGDDDGLW